MLSLTVRQSVDFGRDNEPFATSASQHVLARNCSSTATPLIGPGLGSESNDPQLPSSTVPSVPLHRKRGRPKGSRGTPKPVKYGPSPRRGRPPGTGHKQKQSLLGPTRLTVRPRGRPRKQVSLPTISIEFNKAVGHNIFSVLIVLLIVY